VRVRGQRRPGRRPDRHPKETFVLTLRTTGCHSVMPPVTDVCADATVRLLNRRPNPVFRSARYESLGWLSVMQLRAYSAGVMWFRDWWSAVVVLEPPVVVQKLCFEQAVEALHLEQFAAEVTVGGFDELILPGRAGLDVPGLRFVEATPDRDSCDANS
jgi:hypothetical protein